jgi:hypothetical protein
MEKKILVLPNKLYERAPDQNLSLRINFDESKNLLREGDRDVVLDVSEQFNKERNECKNYKIFGKVRMVFRNTYSGDTTYSPLQRNLSLSDDGSNSDWTGFINYNEFAFLRNDVLREKNTPLSGLTPSDFSPLITLTDGVTDHLGTTQINAPYKNWNFYLSYVYSADTSYPMKYTLSDGGTFSFQAKDGIPFRARINGKYYTFTSPVEHGIKQGEYLTILESTLNSGVPSSGRTFYVNTVGNQTYNSEKYVINILRSQFNPSLILDRVIIGKRCININKIDETTSEYYVHKHKTLTNQNNYILDKAGFESPIFEEERKLLFQNSQGIIDYYVEKNRMEAVLFDFKEPYTLSGITNNFNYTPTELYVTIIFRNDNGYFNYPPKLGYRFHFHDTWVDNHFSGTTSNETTLTSTPFINSGITFNRGNSLPIGTILTGAFVEYNKTELKERIISEAFHKITSPLNIFNHGQNLNTTLKLASNNNLVGIGYQPHHRVKIRELSPYIETSQTNDIYNLPENLIYDKNENLWKWRDLYDHGYVDVDGFGTNFPFLNNTHYIQKTINFYLLNEKDLTNKQDGIKKSKNLNIDC